MLDELTGYAIRRAQLIVTEAFDTSLYGNNMTTQRFSALVLIKENPGLKQTDLARIMGIARSGALAIINALIEEGLVDQSVSNNDRRASALHLSRLGKNRVSKIIDKVKVHDKDITGALSAKETDELHRLLAKIRSTR